MEISRGCNTNPVAGPSMCRYFKATWESCLTVIASESVLRSAISCLPIADLLHEILGSFAMAGVLHTIINPFQGKVIAYPRLSGNISL